MMRREFLVGASSMPLVCSIEGQKPPTLQEALVLLEGAIRRELGSVKEMRVSFEPDERKSIALLVAVVRAPVVSQPVG